MTEFFYQIKGKKSNEDKDYGSFDSPWSWPPIFSGSVSADSKKEAKFLIDDEYGVKFPQRVLRKDLASHNFLLKITEMHEKDARTNGLFMFHSCKQCDNEFRIIDKYNDDNERNKGFDFCSESCCDTHRKENQDKTWSEGGYSKHPDVIYHISNIKTGMCYVGQTTQCFTLRWYQHFFHGGDCKFHEAIKNSSPIEWTFSVIEIIDYDEKPEEISKDEYRNSREAFYINRVYNSIENGYNSKAA